jgi:holin-like protein
LPFIPAGAGVMLHFQRMSDEWPPLLGSLAASTAITIAVTALALQVLARHGRANKHQP